MIKTVELSKKGEVLTGKIIDLPDETDATAGTGIF